MGRGGYISLTRSTAIVVRFGRQKGKLSLPNRRPRLEGVASARALSASVKEAYCGPTISEKYAENVAAKLPEKFFSIR